MNLYEYAVLYVPEDDEGKVQRSECRVLVDPTTMLASDEKTVAGMADAQPLVSVVVRANSRLQTPSTPL